MLWNFYGLSFYNDRNFKNKSITNANKIVNEFINTIESQKFDVEIDKELVDAVNMVKKFTSQSNLCNIGLVNY